VRRSTRYGKLSTEKLGSALTRRDLPKHNFVLLKLIKSAEVKKEVSKIIGATPAALRPTPHLSDPVEFLSS
jgi:hypothetical protein